uniref:U5-Liphistoxin-Lm1a_1 n=1 Tax=Liphistius malayanus TaxID=1203467 RepID=A0A482Z762_9ARAC
MLNFGRLRSTMKSLMLLFILGCIDIRCEFTLHVLQSPFLASREHDPQTEAFAIVRNLQDFRIRLVSVVEVSVGCSLMHHFDICGSGAESFCCRKVRSKSGWDRTSYSTSL